MACAVKYYEVYGYDYNDVLDKIENQEIVIGMPEVNENAIVYADNNGRYIIERKDINHEKKQV